MSNVLLWSPPLVGFVDMEPNNSGEARREIMVEYILHFNVATYVTAYVTAYVTLAMIIYYLFHFYWPLNFTEWEKYKNLYSVFMF